VRQNDVEKDRILVTVLEGVKHGVTGIVANDIVRRFNRPVVLLIIEKDEAMGAARSIAGVDIVSLIEKCKDIVIKYGGHKAAAGLTVAKDNVPKFVEKIKSLAAENITDELLVPELMVDNIVSLGDVTLDLIKELELLEPCGAGNPFPVFVAGDIMLGSVSGVGTDGAHLKVGFRDGRCFVSGIGWRMGSMVPELCEGQRVDVVFQMEINVWQSRESAQMLILDLKKSAGGIVSAAAQNLPF
jgi:single-stranded-DNA-specific exonuclease